METKELIEVLNKMTASFKNLVELFTEMGKAAENKDINALNTLSEKIRVATREVSELENERIKITRALCDKYKIKESARALATELKNAELTEALNSLIDSINELSIKRDYTMNILQTHVDYLNFSIDYFKKLLNFGNYNEKGQTSKYINLLDKEG